MSDKEFFEILLLFLHISFEFIKSTTNAIFIFRIVRSTHFIEQNLNYETFFERSGVACGFKMLSIKTSS